MSKPDESDGIIQPMAEDDRPQVVPADDKEHPKEHRKLRDDDHGSETLIRMHDPGA